MATDLSGFAAFAETFMDKLREAMESLATVGENYVRANSSINPNTGSLLASVTGYEATIGDPMRNFNSPDWQMAQEIGNLAARLKGRRDYGNPPEHYTPHVEGGLVTENPTAIVAIFTEYPVPGKGADVWLGEEVDGILLEAMDYMGSQVLRVVQDRFRWDSESDLGIKSTTWEIARLEG